MMPGRTLVAARDRRAQAAGRRAPKRRGHLAKLLRWATLWALAMVVTAAPMRRASAQPPSEPEAAPPAAKDADDLAASPAPAASSALGPQVIIEAIEVVGNASTAERLIRRAMAVTEGDALQAGDPRLTTARFKILALGYFREVDLRLRKGSARGRVVLTVRVVERGTISLNDIFLGTSRVTPVWAGIDLTERNFFGTGIGVGGAFVVAKRGDATFARRQNAFRLRMFDRSVRGSSIGWSSSLRYFAASEPYRISGDPQDSDADHFASLNYRSLRGRAGVNLRVTPSARIGLHLIVDALDAERPAAPTQLLPDGTSAPIDLLLEDGKSHVAAIAATYRRDTRPDTVLPYTGSNLSLYAKAAVRPISSYSFGSFLARYAKWHEVRPRHVISWHLTAGAVLGDAPRTERLHISDVNRMLSPRPLDLVVQTAPPLDVFNTGAGAFTYGEIAGLAEVQYAYRLFRRSGMIYGGDAFVGVGLWTLHTTRDLPSDPPAFPTDLLLDAGVRLDTAIGSFELSLTNALGRVPL